MFVYLQLKLDLENKIKDSQEKKILLIHAIMTMITTNSLTRILVTTPKTINLNAQVTIATQKIAMPKKVMAISKTHHLHQDFQKNHHALVILKREIFKIHRLSQTDQVQKNGKIFAN